MESTISVLKERANLEISVKAKMLQYLQDWRHIAKSNKKELGFIIEAVEGLERDGFELPPPNPITAESGKAFTEAPVAPEWSDNMVCTKCRSEFGTFLRKHHCRNCGRIFCYKCSTKTMPLPWYSVNDPVRVCDGCFQRKCPVSKASKSDTDQVSLSKPSRSEDDELTKVMALSLKEYNERQSASVTVNNTSTRSRFPETTDAEDDPELAAAIAASLHELDKHKQKEITQPEVSSSKRIPNTPNALSCKLPAERTLEVDANDLDNILTFYDTVVQSNASWISKVPGSGIPLPIQNIQDKAAASRFNVAKKSDYGHRRLRELTDLHEKLSEVVKMYDTLLDKQFEGRVSFHDVSRQPDVAPMPTVHDFPSAPSDPFNEAFCASAPVIPENKYISSDPIMASFELQKKDPGMMSNATHERDPTPTPEPLLIDL